MLIKELNKLMEKQIKDIRKLEAICKDKDNLCGDTFIDTSINFDENINSAYLLYDDKNELVSFLYMFIPTNKEAEVSAFTLPHLRKKGYFKFLLSKACKELDKYSVPEILFVCEKQSMGGKKTIEKLNGKYEFTEYMLIYNKDKNLYSDIKSKIKLHRVKERDLEKTVELNEKIFKEDYENAKNMVTNILKSDNRLQYIAYMDTVAIGIICTAFENDQISIFGFGIDEKFRGKGYGKQILNLIINKLTSEGKSNITLEVDSNNEIAFNLYKKTGFETDVAFQYYRKCVII